ncbi:MAG: hypothetical protein JXA33_07575, partial [Anaerolineae bacterium]|nr:hypothetical protein [Anaerolineae bacterium]
MLNRRCRSFAFHVVTIVCMLGSIYSPILAAPMDVTASESIAANTILAEVSLLDDPPFNETEPASTDMPLISPEEVAEASSPTLPHIIYLQSRQFTPTTSEIATLRTLAASGQQRIHVLLQLDFIPRQAAKDALAAEGIELLAYIPDYTWIASIPASRAANVVERTGVIWMGQLQVNDKLDPAIVAEQWGTHNLTPNGVAAVYLALHSDESLETGRALVTDHGGTTTGEVVGLNLLVVEMPRANIEELAAEDAVQWIEQA